MKKSGIIVLALVFLALWLIAGAARGGELTGIDFAALGEFNTNNGELPNDAPVLATDGNLYGTTIAGGTNGVGVIFKDTTGGQLTVLHYFSTNSWDGDYPYAPLTVGQDGNLYGVTAFGGAYGQGTIFEITIHGLFTQLYSFGTELNEQGYALDGSCPEGGLIQGRDGNFYGVTRFGGPMNEGTVFQFFTNGILNTLHSFAGNGSNDDGINPLFASLVEGADGIFYGTTFAGGTNDDGTIFQITADGTFSTLFEFNGTNGLYPYAGLSLGTDGNLYGATSEGGTNQDGNVFQITTNGVLTTLVEFNGTNGLLPYSGVVLGLDNTIYGTTYEGGPAFVPGIASGAGTVFQVTTNGSLTTLYSFTGGDDGSFPYGGVFRDGMGHWYGTATSGGAESSGTVYSLTDTIDPTLAITSPAAGQYMTNALATFTGTAGDNLGCGSVWCQLNGGPWNLATTENGDTNWTITDTLIAGTNTLNAYAVDFSGNFSSTNSLSVVSSNTFVLQLSFDTAQPLSANGLSLNLETSPGLSGQIQASTNLVNWTTLTNFGGTGTNWQFNDETAPDYKQRFYRAVIP
jgi:uncharacterized repeat protein (TIGR03803 family)